MPGGRYIRYNGRKIHVNDVVKEYDELIRMIAYRWISLRKYDHIIDKKDLEQDLRLHLLEKLPTYRQEKGSALKSFIITLSRRFFINKLKTAKNQSVLKFGNNGTSCVRITHVNLHTKVSKDTLLCDTIPSFAQEEHPEQKLLFEECVREIRKKLNQIKYTPDGFIERKRTFTLKMFDLLYNPPEKFLQYVRFERNCRIRLAKATDTKVATRKCIPSLNMVAEYMGVYTRAADISSKFIQQTINRYRREDEKRTVIRKRKEIKEKNN